MEDLDDILGLLPDKDRARVEALPGGPKDDGRPRTRRRVHFHESVEHELEEVLTTNRGRDKQRAKGVSQLESEDVLVQGPERSPERAEEGGTVARVVAGAVVDNQAGGVAVEGIVEGVVLGVPVVVPQLLSCREARP